jgi:apolipoprotein N-acyltransferase
MGSLRGSLLSHGWQLLFIGLFLIRSHPALSFERELEAPFFQLAAFCWLFRLSCRVSATRAVFYWMLVHFATYAFLLRWMAQSPYLAPWGVVGQYLTALLMSAGVGFWCWVSRRFFDLETLKGGIALSLLWGLIEWSRQFWFCGFPWYGLSLAWINTSLGIELLGVLGPFGLSAFIIGFYFCLSRLRRNRGYKGLTSYLVVSSALFIFSRLLTPTYSLSVQVAALHTSMPLHYFAGSWNRLDVWTKLLEKSPPWKKAPWASPRICLTHEGLLPDGLKTANTTLSSPVLAAKLARLWNCYLILGLEDDQLDLEIANAVGIWEPTGELKGYYHKQILLPFAEYFPMMDWPIIGSWLVALSQSYGILQPLKMGLISGLYPIGDIPVLFSICFEETFPSFIAREVRQGALLWMSASNDGWFPDSGLAGDHYLQARLVSASTGLALVRSTQKGYSAVLNGEGRPVGLILSPDDNWGWLIADGLKGRYTLYGQMHESFGLLAAVFMILRVSLKPGIWSLRRKATRS